MPFDNYTMVYATHCIGINRNQRQRNPHAAY